MRGIFIDAEYSAFSLCGIIAHVFTSIARSNSVVMSETMTTSDRATMMGIVKSNRHKFRLLQKAAATAVSRRSDRSRANTRSPSPASLLSFARSATPLFIDSRPTTSRSKYAAPQTSSASAGKSKSQMEKQSEYESGQKWPNIHIGIHHADIAKEYATVFNVNGLIGEDKHR